MLFGQSTDMNQYHLVVSSPYDSDTRGLVLVNIYHRSPVYWLTAPTPAPGQYFGSKVQLNGHELLVSDVTNVYVYDLTSGTPVLTKIVRGDTSTFAQGASGLWVGTPAGINKAAPESTTKDEEPHQSQKPDETLQ